MASSVHRGSPSEDSHELARQRTLLALGAVLYPAWWPIFTFLVPGAEDSLWGRLGVGALAAALYGLSFTKGWARAHLPALFQGLLYVMTAHYFVLLHHNGMHTGYAVGTFVVVLGISSAIVSLRALVAYSLFVVALATLCAVASPPGPLRIVLPLGLATVLVVAFTALQARLRALDALADSERSFRDLFNATFEGILLHDGERILDVNEGGARLFGYRRDELIGSDVFLLVHPDSRELVRRNIAQRHEGLVETRPYELVGIKKDGTRFALEAAGKRHVYRGLKVSLIATRDISERKEMETRLRLADRLASLGTLAAGVGHEINNPLFVVMGNLDIAMEAVDAQPALPEKFRSELKASLETAHRGADRVRVIVRDLKFLSRQDEQSLGAVDIHHVLDSSASMTNNEVRHRARLVKQYGKVPRVYGNDARLGQVFVNLLVNAAQAIVEGESARNEIRLTTRHDGNRVIVEVSDTGRGMSSDVMNRIFDPFFTTKPVGVGTGLGLSICHKIVSALGGDISVESNVGKGTTFRVSLPVAERQISATSTASPVPMARSARRRRILVVDDEPEICALVQRMLSDEHDVTTAGNGREALRIHRELGPFDIILCDLMMPEMTGMEVFEQLKASQPGHEERIVFMTGGAFTALSKDFLKNVPNYCLEKPIQFSQLRHLISGLSDVEEPESSAA